MNLHVLWIPSWYPDKEEPYNGDFIYRRALAVSRFCRVMVLHAAETDVRERYIEEKAINDNFSQMIVYYPKANHSNTQLRRMVKFFRMFKAFQLGWSKIIEKKVTFQLVQLSVIYPAGIFVLWLHFFKKLPFIITEHWTGYRKSTGDYKGCFLKILGKWCVKRAKIIIPVTDFAGKAMQQHGLSGKYIPVPNVVDIGVVPERQQQNDGKCHLIHVSTLNDAQKNITGLLEVIKRVSAIRTDFILELVGGDPVTNLTYFKRKVTEMELDKFVKFSGMIPHREVFEKLSKADTFVLFSNYEGLPCSMLEGMAMGLSIITTEIGDMYKWITPEVGKVIPIGDQNALFDALLYMLANYQQFDGKKIQSQIAQTCSYDVIGQQLVAIYKEALNY